MGGYSDWLKETGKPNTHESVDEWYARQGINQGPPDVGEISYGEAWGYVDVLDVVGVIAPITTVGEPGVFAEAVGTAAGWGAEAAGEAAEVVLAPLSWLWEWKWWIAGGVVGLVLLGTLAPLARR